jgi:hypothetical protein
MGLPMLVPLFCGAAERTLPVWFVDFHDLLFSLPSPTESTLFYSYET